MLYLGSLLLSIIMPCLFLCADFDDAHLQKIKLQECLKNCWGVDPYTTDYLCRYFESFLSSQNSNFLIEDFIHKSVRLNIQFPMDKKLHCLSAHDGVLQATQFHPIVYETPYVRILAGCANPGEREPFHAHAWRSLLVIFEDAAYDVEYADGTHECLNLQPGIYELPPEDLYACTNVGLKKENCLRFEVKD